MYLQAPRDKKREGEREKREIDRGSRYLLVLLSLYRTN